MIDFDRSKWCRSSKRSEGGNFTRIAHVFWSVSLSNLGFWKLCCGFLLHSVMSSGGMISHNFWHIVKTVSSQYTRQHYSIQSQKQNRYLLLIHQDQTYPNPYQSQNTCNQTWKFQSKQLPQYLQK